MNLTIDYPGRLIKIREKMQENNNDEFRDMILQENMVEVAAVVMNVPGIGGMRLEVPVRVTKDGGEMLCQTPLELTVLDL